MSGACQDWVGQYYARGIAGVPERTQTYVYTPRVCFTTELTPASLTYNLVNVRGIPQNPTFRAAEVENLIETFPARPDDFFICTFPKCGTTWTQQIVHLLTHGGEQGETTIYDTAPWLEVLYAHPILHEREANNLTMEQIEARPGPRFFKSHANFPDLPRGQCRDVKVINIARNPKDTCVSLYKHAGEKPEFGMAGEFDDFVELFLAGKVECGSWFNHTLEWYAASLVDPNVLFLTYEGMIKDPAGSILKIAQFIGVDGAEVGSDLLTKTVANSSMDAMKKGKTGIYAGNMRKGGVGNWRKTFSPESSALFDRVYAAQMRNTGLQFDFGDGLVM